MEGLQDQFLFRNLCACFLERPEIFCGIFRASVLHDLKVQMGSIGKLDKRCLSDTADGITCIDRRTDLYAVCKLFVQILIVRHKSVAMVDRHRHSHHRIAVDLFYNTVCEAVDRHSRLCVYVNTGVTAVIVHRCRVYGQVNGIAFYDLSVGRHNVNAGS